MKNWFSWLLESHRLLHLIGGLAIGLLLGPGACLAAAFVAEFKDWLWNGAQGGCFGWISGHGFDWLDFLATVLGGSIGVGIYYILEHFLSIS